MTLINPFSMSDVTATDAPTVERVARFIRYAGREIVEASIKELCLPLKYNITKEGDWWRVTFTAPGRYNMKVDVWKYAGNDSQSPIISPLAFGLQPGFEVLATEFHDLFAVIAARRAIYEREHEAVRRRAETAKAIQAEADQKYVISLFTRAASTFERRTAAEDDGMVTITRYTNVYGSGPDDLRAGGGCTYSTPEEATAIAKDHVLATGVPITVHLPRAVWEAMQRKNRRR